MSSPIFSQKIPVVVKNEEKIFLTISEILEQQLPKNIEILVYEPNILNDKKKTGKIVTENFHLILSTQQLVRTFKLHFISDILKKNIKIDPEFIKKANEQQLIGFAKLLDIDAVLLTNITIFNEKLKKIWDKSKKRWESKNIALIQGNVFTVSDNSPIIRFAYYFLIDFTDL